MFLLLNLCLIATSFGIYVPSGNLSSKPLHTLGIKTIKWQDSTQRPLLIHQSYSNVKLQQHSDAKNLENVYENNRNRGDDQQVMTDFDQFEDFGQTDQVSDNQFAASTNTGFLDQTQDIGQKSENYFHTSTHTGRKYPTKPIRYTTSTSTSHQNNYSSNRTPKQYNNIQNYYSGNKFQTTLQQDIRVYSKCPSGETGQFVYELSCNQFLNCHRGRGYAQNCAPGTLFNPKTLECDFADKVQCVSGPKEFKLDPGSIAEKIQATCPKEFTGIIPYYTDCSKFINCANGREHVMDCAPGTLFDVRTNICNFPHTVECVNGENAIILRESNQNGYSSGQILNSNSGQYHNSYQSGQELRQGQNLKQAKQLEQNFGRFYGSHGVGQNQSQTFAKVTQLQRPTCPPGYTGLHEHPSDCKKFLNCANGATHIQDCGPGTVFNSVSKVCDFPYNTKCGHQGSAQNQQNWNSQGRNEGHGSSSGWNQNRHNPSSSQSEIHNSQGSSQSGNWNSQGSTQQGNAQNWNSQVGNNGHGWSSSSSGWNHNRHNPSSSQSEIHNSQGSSQSGNWNSQGRNDGYTWSSSSASSGWNQNRQNPTVAQSEIPGSQGSTQTQQGNAQNWASSSSGWNQNRQNRTLSQSETHGTNDAWAQKPNVHWNSGFNQTRYTDVNQNHNVNGNQESASNWNAGFNQNAPSSTDWNQNRQDRTNYNQQAQGSTVYKWGATTPRSPSGSSTRQKPQFNYDQTSQTLDETVPDDDIEQLTNRPPNWKLRNPSVPTNSLEPPANDKNWPPPFPATDLNSDYVFELDDLDVMLEPDFIGHNTERGNFGSKNWCDSKGYECGNKVCIPPALVCDGKKDCMNGKDEIDCDQALSQFTSTVRTKLAAREVKKIANVTLKWCAKNCVEDKSLKCISFNYRKYDGMCFLLNTNVGMTGALIILPNYDYYEHNAYGVDCSHGHLCRNKKCITSAQICDGSNDCSDWSDEKGCSPNKFGYGIKLAGSKEMNSGRIEVTAFGKTGYICDDMFGLRNADVACRELGFPLGALEVKGNSVFAADLVENDTFYMMDDVSCLGNETTLMDCDFNGWGKHNCRPQEIVGVVCKTPLETCPHDHWQCNSRNECLQTAFVCDGVYDCTDSSDEDPSICESSIEVRLVNGTSKMNGRVEIRYHGIWGTVCDDDFNDEAAKVVCNQLGFRGAGIVKKGGYFGPGIGPIWLDQVFCQGSETRLASCGHWDWGEHNCDHSEDVGVVCSQIEVAGKPRNIHLEEDAMPETETLPKTCGFRKDAIFLQESDVHFRVVKGSLATPGEYPWQASIRVKGKTTSSHWCGAVVISRRYVLTAAHCLVGYSKGAYTIMAGDYNVDTIEGTEQEVYIDDFQIHPDFRHGNKMNNDIALIKLKGSGFKFTDAVQPICLPDSTFTKEQNMNCTISGFGSIESGKSRASHELRAGWIPVQSREICKMPHVYGDAITPGMLCAGSLDEGVDACDGDSGGPLACLHDGVFTLMGITSWGQHCGYANKPGVYVKVAFYRNWIEDTIKKMQ